MKTPLPSDNKPKIIDSFWAFLVATALLGPLALPLLWRNPRYKTSTKVAGSIAVLLFTYFLLRFAGSIVELVYTTCPVNRIS